MKMPRKCPICNEPLMNQFKETYDKNGYALEKTCDKKLDHIFFCASKKADEDEVYVVSATTREKNSFMALWVVPEKKLHVARASAANRTIIPYFEPDFTNFKKLYDKLRMYILFS